MKFIFVVGCPRSGTTALARLLNGSPDIVIGIERYQKVAFTSGLTPALFEYDRFFTIEEGDTHYESLDDFDKSYVTLREKYKGTKTHGDKIPPLFRAYDSVNSAFPDVGFIFIVRNLIDVANSYMHRFENPKDPWKRDFKRAVKDWNQSLALTTTALANGIRIHVVSYERLFADGAQDVIEGVFNFADARLPPANLVDGILGEGERVERRREERENLITGAPAQFLCSHGSFGIYRRLVGKDAKRETAHGL